MRRIRAGFLADWLQWESVLLVIVALFWREFLCVLLEVEPMPFALPSYHVVVALDEAGEECVSAGFEGARRSGHLFVLDAHGNTYNKLDRDGDLTPLQRKPPSSL